MNTDQLQQIKDNAKKQFDAMYERMAAYIDDQAGYADEIAHIEFNVEETLKDLNAVSWIESVPNTNFRKLLRLWVGLHDCPAAPDAWYEVTYDKLIELNIDESVAEVVSDRITDIANAFDDDLFKVSESK